MSRVAGIGGAGSVEQIMALRQQIMERSQILQQLHGAREAQGTAPVSGPVSMPGPTPVQPGGGFAETLRSALDSVNATQNHASEMSAAYERGEVTDIASVMLARQESSVAFEATLQVRNKLLSAYQDIMRMGV